MATWEVHVILGQSNAVGTENKTALTDLRYDFADTDVVQIQRLNGAAVTAPATLAIGGASFSVEAAIGHRRKTAGAAKVLIYRDAFSGTTLASSWRADAGNTMYDTAISTLWERIDYCRRTAYPGDTFVIKSLTWVQGESDADNHDYAVAFLANLRTLVRQIRIDLASDLPIFIVRLSASYTSMVDGIAVDPVDLALVRSAVDTIASDTARVYSISADAVPLKADGTHYTADGLMQLGDLIADAMATDGLAVTQYPREVRIFSSLANAQTFASAAQTACGNRDENPANGGFGSRGAGARDPWPTTPRSAIKKHPIRSEWGVVIDPVIRAEGSLDSETLRRPFAPRSWSYVQ